MKAFLEEYGLVIVAVIVVSLLIVLAVYFGNTSRSNMQSTFDDFNGQSQKVVNSGLNTANDTLFQINAETVAKQAGEAAVHCTCPSDCQECRSGHFEDCKWSSKTCSKDYVDAYNKSLSDQWIEHAVQGGAEESAAQTQYDVDKVPGKLTATTS